MRENLLRKSLLRIMAMAIAVASVLFTFPEWTIKAQALSTGAQAAVDYANAHWDDGKGLCAEFVSDCLKAGGIEGAWSRSCGVLHTALINNGLGTDYLITPNSNNYYTMSGNSGKLSPGDPIFVKCNTCSVYPHVYICTGESNNIALVSAHNIALNNLALNGIFTNDSHPGHSFEYHAVHMNYPNTVSEPTFSNFSVSNITKNGAELCCDVLRNGTNWTEKGAYVGTSLDALSPACTYNNLTGDEGQIWCPAHYLEPGTLYYARFYVIADGMTYWSEPITFTTLEEVEFEPLENGNYSVRCIKKKSKGLVNLTVPAYYNGIRVQKIAENGYGNCQDLETVVIPSEIDEIMYNGFGSCPNLKSVKFNVNKDNGASVIKIGNYAFAYCPKLTKIEFPSSLTEIGDSAFSSCTSLASVTIPNSVTSIVQYAFYNCTSLKDVYYTGTKEEWDKISIGDNNDPLKNATIHYNYKPVTVGKIANLKAAPARNSVKLTWGKNTSAKYYKVFVWRSNKWSQLTQTTSNSALNYTASGLTANTSYKFRVTAYNANNKAIAYSDISTKTLANVANLKTVSAKNSIKLTWSRNASAKYYKVFVWNNGKCQLLKQINNSSAPNYTASKLSANTSYKFRVTAYNASNKAIAFSDVSAKTLANVANLKASPSKNTVKLTWGKNTSAKYYKVFVWKNGKYTQLTQTKNNTTVSYTASKLSANTSYKFRVTAYNSSNKAIAFSDISTRTLANISNLKAVPAKNSVKLTWSKNTSAKYYKVFVWKNNKWTQLTQTANNSVVNYTASNLTVNTAYKYRVTAYNSSNKAIAFSDISTRTIANIANLKTTVTKNSVKLTWSRNASAKYYKVFVWNNGKYQLLKQLNNSTAPNYTEANLKLNTAYKYRVTAYNTSNKAIAFSDISTRTLANISNLKAVPAKNFVKLTWSKNTSAKYYKVFVWKNGKWTQLTQTKSNSVLTYTASKLTANTSYKFRVTAYNASSKVIAFSDITVKTKK